MGFLVLYSIESVLPASDLNLSLKSDCSPGEGAVSLFASAQNLLVETLHFHPTPFLLLVKLNLQTELTRKTQSYFYRLPLWFTSLVGHLRDSSSFFLWFHVSGCSDGDVGLEHTPSCLTTFPKSKSKLTFGLTRTCKGQENKN